MPPPQTSVCWDYRHEPHSQLERETGIVESGSGGSTLGGRKGAQAKGNTGSSEAGKVILWGPISAPGFPKGSFCRHLDFSHKPTGGGVLGVQGVIVQCSSLSRLSLLVQRLSRTSLILAIVTPKCLPVSSLLTGLEAVPFLSRSYALNALLVLRSNPELPLNTSYSSFMPGCPNLHSSRIELTAETRE